MTVSVKSYKQFLNFDNLNFGPVGSLKPTAADISSTDYTVTSDIRLITCSSGTKIKVDMICSDGAATSVTLPISCGFIQAINVTKIYKTGTDATDIYLWPFES
jgi:hypothetical protein